MTIAKLTFSKISAGQEKTTDRFFVLPAVESILVWFQVNSIHLKMPLFLKVGASVDERVCMILRCYAVRRPMPPTEKSTYEMDTK